MLSQTNHITTEVIGKFTFTINREKLTLLTQEFASKFKNGCKIHSNFRFRTIEQLEFHKETFLAIEAKKDQDRKERLERKRELRQLPNPCKVGDIFYDSWGYEQTNIDFFEVIEVVGKCVKVKEVKQKANYDHGYMSGTTEPLKGEFLGDAEPVKKLVLWTAYGGVPKPYLKSRYGWCSLYNGVPKSYSSYA